MNQLTKSEILFEKTCATLGLSIRRIHTASRPRPDYKVATRHGGLVVEVKEVGANDDDKEYQRQRDATGRSCGGVSLTRLRPLVAAANKQLRPWAARGIPTVVVLYDTNLFQLYTEDHHVKSLFGELGISGPVGGKGTPAQDVVFATNQTLSPQKNRSISAVVTMREAQDGTTLLALFHNPFARVRVAKGCAEALGLREVSYRFQMETE